jgi:hypothetical protein
MAETDLDKLDASWDDDEDEADEPDHDLDALDAGWDDPRRYKTAAERAAARKEKMRLRAERQKARASLAEQSQKKKKPKQRRSVPQAQVAGSPEAIEQSARRDASRSWVVMLVAIAVIIAVAACVLFLKR